MTVIIINIGRPREQYSRSQNERWSSNIVGKFIILGNLDLYFIEAYGTVIRVNRFPRIPITMMAQMLEMNNSG